MFFNSRQLMTKKKAPRSIFQQLVERSAPLTHFKDDLWVHDFEALKKMPVGSSWLWFVHKAGTHLTRWDHDPFAGTRDSMPELFVRGLDRGDWATATCYIFHVEAEDQLGPLGWVSGSLAVQDLKNALPRPRVPAGMMPGAQPASFDASKQETFSAATGFYFLNQEVTR